MQEKQLRQIVLAALFTALTTVATLVIQIPSPGNGYVNLGDCMVLLSAWVLGPVGGAAAGGLGSMLADLMTGYAYYAPGTLVIKGAMALTAGLIFRALTGGTVASPRALAARAAGGVAAEAIMVAGYFGYAALLLGSGLGAAASIPGNLIQGAFGLVTSLALAGMLERSGVLKRVWEG